MAERKVKQWITINGVHVPIFEGESKADAAKRFKEKIGKRNENQPMTQNAKSQVKKEYTYARNAAHNAKPEKQEKANERFEKAKNKYSKSKEAGVIKSAKRTDDRSARSSVYKEQLKDVQEDIKQFESTPERLRSADYEKRLAELKKKEANLKGYIDRDKLTQAGKKQELKNVPPEMRKKLERQQVANRANEKFIDSQASKLKEHGYFYMFNDEIQGDKFEFQKLLKSKGLEVVDNDQQGNFRIGKAKGEQTETQKQLAKDFDEKEKQIAANAKEANRLQDINSFKSDQELTDYFNKTVKPLYNSGRISYTEYMRQYNEILKKSGQLAQNKNQAENANTVFGKEMNDKISNYQDKFLKSKTSEQLDEIQRNLEKGSNIVGYTEQDNIALAAIRKEKEKRADIEYLTALYEAQSYRQERGQDTSKVDAKIAEVKDRLLKDKRTGQEGGLSDKEMREKGYVIDTPITDEMVARGEKKRVAREIADENNAREAKIQEIRQRTGLSLEDSERQLDKTSRPFEAYSTDQLQKTYSQYMKAGNAEGANAVTKELAERNKGVESKADFNNSRELWKVDREYQRHEASGVHDRQALKKGSEYTFEFNGRDGKKTVEGTYEGTELKGGESVSYFKGKDGKRYVLFDEDIKGNVKPNASNTSNTSYNSQKSYKVKGPVAAAKSAGEMLGIDKPNISIKRETAIDTTYSLKDKDGNEVGIYTESRTGKGGKLTLYKYKNKKG